MSARASSQIPHRPQGRLRRILLGLAGLLPCLLAMAASAVGPRPAESAPGAERSPLAFHQYMVNLGDVPARRNHFARFAFTNRGSRPVEIRKLITSCGCLTEHLERRVFAAGETGELLLRIQAASQLPGSKEYTCEVISGPPGDESVAWSTRLVFRIVLPEQSVTLKPRALIVHQYSDQPTQSVVSIQDTRERPLTVKRADCDMPFVSVSLRPRDELTTEETEYGIVQQVQVVVRAAPPGQHDFSVRVVTDDPEFDVIRIPVRVYGPAGPDTAASDTAAAADKADKTSRKVSPAPALKPVSAPDSAAGQQVPDRVPEKTPPFVR